jgi:Smg protein
MIQKTSILSVLMYVFERFTEFDGVTIESQDDSIVKEMLQAGFNVNDVENALLWFSDLNHLLCESKSNKSTQGAFRIYTDHENNKLQAPAKQYLETLTHSNVIHASEREIILDRLMALNSGYIDTHDVKWVTMLVLFGASEGTQSIHLLDALTSHETQLRKH